MNSAFIKSLIQTNTGRAGILAIAAGLLEGFATGNWSSAIDKILVGLAMVFGRQAIMKRGQTTAEFKAEKDSEQKKVT